VSPETAPVSRTKHRHHHIENSDPPGMEKERKERSGNYMKCMPRDTISKLSKVQKGLVLIRSKTTEEKELYKFAPE